jgi:predicted permease
MAWFARLLNVIRPGAHSRDLDREMGFHLAARTDDLIVAGRAPDAAREEARRRFGNYGQQKESARERDIYAWLDSVFADVRYACRALRAAPAFALVAIGSLALGIGANSAIFTVVDALLLRDLPVREPEQLVVVGDPGRVRSHFTGAASAVVFSYPLYRDLRDHNGLVTGLIATGTADRLDVRVRDSGTTAPEVEHPVGRFVSANYFSVLGVGAARGTVFDGTEDRAVGAAPVVVISDRWWTRRFARANDIVGRIIDVDGATVTVIGVAPPGFMGEIVGAATDIWIPIGMQPVMQPQRAPIESRGTSWLLLMGRLGPGVSLAQARAGFTTLIHNALAANPTEPGNGQHYRTVPTMIVSGTKGLSGLRVTYGVPLLTLMAGVALLMLIVCANVANLLLARSMARAREMTVRLAIGAGRARLVRQLLTESVVLAALGAVLGLALAYGGGPLLLTIAADGGAEIPLDVRLDLPVLGFTIAAAIVTVVMFGLAPAFRGSRIDLAGAMQAHGRSVAGSRGGRFPLGKMLVAAQVGLSFVLLVGASLLTRSLLNLEATDPGLDRDHLLVMELDPLDHAYRGPKLATLLHDLSVRLARIPGVAAVTYSQNGIFTGSGSGATVGIPGFSGRTPEDSSLAYDFVGPGYLKAIGARLIAGRDISEDDRLNAPSVAVVNQAFAKFYFADASPIGRTIRFDENTSSTIVGLVADVRDYTLTAAPERFAYVPYIQQVNGKDDPSLLVFDLRAAGDPATLASAVRGAVADVDPQLVVASAAPLTATMRQSISTQRLMARLAGAFGALALLLAAVGLYGVMTYTVARRTREIGLRMALGAQRSAVVALIVGDAIGIVVLGIALGVPMALASVRLLRSQLHGVNAMDPASIGLGMIVLAISALAAALVPARRASRVAPMVALRED